MNRRVFLIRHGKSGLVHRQALLSKGDVEVWRRRYDAAGIDPGVLPPDILFRLAADATHLVTSDMPRAVESAALLAPHRIIQRDPRFREAPLHIPAWPTRLPLRVWGTIIYVNWRYQVLRGVDPHATDTQRAAAAAEHVVNLVDDGSSVCVITHGVFRSLVAEQLVERGWPKARRRGGFRHWSCWEFSPP